MSGDGAAGTARVAGAAGAARGPVPAVAYARWVRACAAAGWRPAEAAEVVEVVGLRDGRGRVAAAEVRARWPVPLAACAAMDGIAIRAAAAPPVRAAAVQPGGAAAVQPGGAWQVPAGAFSWVDTGDPIPAGLDTVVMRERVVVDGAGIAHVSGPVRLGQHVRSSGEDIGAGQLIAPAGHRLRAADIAAAAATGHSELAVVRRPVVRIVPTGDEIRPVGSVIEPGQAIDSNSLMLAMRTEEQGGRPEVSEIQPDDPAALAAELRRCAVAADLVLVIAGSSAGRRDHTAAALSEVGGLAVHGVAVRPGHPVLLGYAIAASGAGGAGGLAGGAGGGAGGLAGGAGGAGGLAGGAGGLAGGAGLVGAARDAVVPVIGVPGYPLAAAVIFELFAVPALATLHGLAGASRTATPARLACDWASSPGVEDWVPVALTAPPDAADDGGAPLATPSRRGAGSISPLLAASAWWPIPAGQTRFGRGDRIEVLPIGMARRDN